MLFRYCLLYIMLHVDTRAGDSVKKRGVGEHEKLRKYFATFENRLTRMPAQRELFRKTAVKSTIFELQQSFFYIFLSL